MSLTKRVAGATVLAAVVMAGPWAWTVNAQAQRTILAVTQATDLQTADQTRTEFRTLLRQFPPALGRVLVLDPTLLTNKAYLEPYPALAQYLAAHPEIARDPIYFLGHLVDSAYQFERPAVDPAMQARQYTVSHWRNMFEAMLLFTGFLAMMFTIGWTFKYVIEHRRWLRTTRTMSEVHGKLMERFTNSEDLKAYMDSPAGQAFLQAAPLTVEQSPKGTVGAPFSRILWSVQVGVVLIALGIGFLVLRRGLETEVQQMIGAWGTLAIALGAGFAISAAASYVISSRLGLLEQKQG